MSRATSCSVGSHVQKAKQGWKIAHDVGQGAGARLENAERECDEIAERLAPKASMSTGTLDSSGPQPRTPPGTRWSRNRPAVSEPSQPDH